MSADTAADTLRVPSQFPTIQDAIDAARHGDTVLVADGIYTGPRNKNLDFAGRLITVVSENGPAACVIDCEFGGRGFYFHNGESALAVVEGFTIRNGLAGGSTPGGGNGGAIFCSDAGPLIRECILTRNDAYDGGAIRCDRGSPTIVDCAITANTAYNGGGIACYGLATPTIERCTIADNWATDWGGGLFCFEGLPRITDCIITRNRAGAEGGGINLAANAVIIDCTITENDSATRGGGIYCEFAAPTIADCDISNNAADEAGGGIYCGLTTRVSNCTLFANTSNIGAGIACLNNPTFVNCLVVANTAELAGGGLACEVDSTPAIINCTFTQNDGRYEGGALLCAEATATLDNCILWNNTPDEIAGYALVTYSDVQGAWPGAGNINADPLFRNPLTADYHLAPRSPCIDAADNTAVPAGFTTDLDGRPRFVDDPATPDTGNGDPPIVDMGAYEFQAGCPADLNNDGVINLADLGILLADFGCTAGPGNCPGDVDGDGDTDLADLGILLSEFGNPCP